MSAHAPQHVGTLLACAIAALGLVACAGNGSQDAGVSVGPIAAPPPPSGSLMVPRFGHAWSPPMLSAGNTDELARQLAAHRSVAVMTGAGFAGNNWEMRIYEMIAALSPSTQVVARDRGMLLDVMRERGELPLAQRVVPSGATDLWGRPTYVVEDVNLDTDWIAERTPLEGAEAFLVLESVDFDLQTWRSRPQYAVGSCEAPLSELATATATNRGVLEPFVSYTNALLWQHYRAELDANLPELREQFEPFAGATAPPDFEGDPRQYNCAHAYWQHIEPMLECGAHPQSCAIAPVLSLEEGVSIAAFEPTVYTPDYCASHFGMDYEADVGDLAGRAARAVTQHLDSVWLDMAERHTAMLRIQRELGEVCEPARRRYRAADIERARQELAEIGELLGGGGMPADGRWRPGAGSHRSEGVGAMRRLLEYRGGEGSVATTALAQLSDFRSHLKGARLCHQGATDMPLAISLVDVGRGDVPLYAYFYEEELFCPGLPPLLAPPTP